MPQQRQSGFITIFIGSDGCRYPSGIVHKTEAAARNALKNEALKGQPLDVIPIEWDEAAGTPPWP